MTEARAGNLVVSALSAGYRGRPVIRALDLGPIAAGEVTAVVGPNAAGKSTLLLAIAGLIGSKGSIKLGDVELGALPLAERAAAMTFMPQVLPQGVGLTVLESVIAALRASPIAENGRAGRDDVAGAIAALERIGITHLALEYLDRLSGGQRQLVALAQVVVRNPRVLLLDEPTSALDLRHQIAVMKLARGIAREGRIVIVVLHDLSLAARWADRMAVIDNGRVVAFGTPEHTLSAELLRDVYGVTARIERSAVGHVHILVDDNIAEYSPASGKREEPP